MVAAVPALAGPLDKPAFTATPAELLAEAQASTVTGHDVAVLRDDVTYTFDARGRLESRYRTVFTVLAPSGADNWGELGLGWQPFYQDPPVIRARVVSADGSISELDASLIHDAPAVKESPSVFSDRRDLSAPLPRLAVGAVVEQEFVFVDREPLLAAGTVRWVHLQRYVPVARKVVTISSPTALRTKIVLRGPKTAWKPTQRVVGDRTVVTYDLRNLTPFEDGDAAAPVDWISAPVLGVATGASWAAIAADYRALVEPKLAAPVAVAPDLLAGTQRATVDRIVAWLHGRVRYTGIELSQSAIVPFAPAETLARGFGDCKDKATLLVGLLRAAKIPADLALLSTGPGVDVDVALPGMGEFDHAIVRARVDGKDLWIDATEDLLPAGQLPLRDQGRRALIIGAGTKALTTTPTGAALDNLIREVRTFHLSEHGAATVTEVSEERGIWSDNLRGFVRNNTKADVAKHLGTYTSEEYSGTYRSHTSTSAGDVTTPFVLTLEMDAVKVTNADRDAIWAWISPYDALAKLPDTFTSSDADIERRVKQRTVDYLWTLQHVYEVVHRFEVPTGYAAPELPASETRALGTMTLTTSRGLAAGVYTITYRLDTGKRLLRADELRATRAAVHALGKEDRPKVVFTLEATRLADQGKAREAIAAIQRLVALHPGEALHHLQLSIRYQLLGLGEAARREAKLATTLEPKNGDAWMVLGHVLARDLTNRAGSVGNDRPAALVALRKAIALSPTHVGGRDELARLLTIDAGGWLSVDRAEHREAVTLLRALREEKAIADADGRLLLSLAMSDDRAGLEALVRDLADGQARREAQVLLAALASGDEALRVATSLAGTHGREALLQAAMSSLTLMRRYDAVRAVARVMPSFPAERRASLDRLAAIDLARLPPKAPETAAILMMHRVVLGARPKSPWSDATEVALERESSGVETRGLPSTVLFDSMMSTTTFTATGDAKAGWTVKIDLAGNVFTLYVVLRNQRAFLVGGIGLTDGIGREMHDLLGRGDLAGARTWLTRLADDPALVADRGIGALLKRHRDAFGRMPKAQLEVLAWLLMPGNATPQALTSLRACSGFTSVDDRDVCFTVSVAAAHTLRDWASAIKFAREELSTSPGDPASLALRARIAAFAPGGVAEAEAAIAGALAKQPDDLTLLRAQATIGMATGWSTAAPRFDRLTAGPNPDLDDLNNGSWIHLFHDATPAVARTLVERAMHTTSQPPPPLRNTYAAVLAEVGEPAAAWDQLSPGLPLHEAIGDADWYVLGRIAEQAGLRDDAIALYRRVRRTNEPGLPTSGDFAQKRLKAMGVTP